MYIIDDIYMPVRIPEIINLLVGLPDPPGRGPQSPFNTYLERFDGMSLTVAWSVSVRVGMLRLRPLHHLPL
jgi:hypothetical protein